MMRPGRRASIDPAGVRAREARARGFLQIADLAIEDGSDALRAVAVSNAVLAGIAASDAICGHLLGEHAQGDDHVAAVAVLKQALGVSGAELARDLQRLLAAKTPTQYGTQRISPTEAAQHLERARRLVDAAAVQLRR